MQIKLSLSKAYLLVCVVLFLFGCRVGGELSGIINSTPTFTISTVEIMEHTLSPTQESVLYAKNTKLTNTPTFTPAPSPPASSESTWTPVPTLSQETKKMNLIDLFETNGGCDWPCWWGVALGNKLDDALALSSVLGKSPYVYNNQYSYTLSFDELNLPDFDLVFFEKEEIIQSIEVILRYPSRHFDYLNSFNKNLSLSSVMNLYGKPSAVMLKIQPGVEKDAPIGYTLIIIYELQGFSIEYDGIVESEEPVKFCLELNNYHLETISIKFQEPNNLVSKRQDLFRQGYRLIENVSPMSLDEFFHFFSNRENIMCIETSLDLWQ